MQKGGVMLHLSKRNPAADLIRIFAFFSVVSVHFFANIEFYSYPLEGKRMYIMTLTRSFFMICVPLFLTLSGYLLRKKQLEKRYYGRIGKILLTYVLASLACVFYSVVFQEQTFSLKLTLMNVLNFTAAPYAWYVEMYVGLFLLIPFLNIVYNGLHSQKAKLWLVITFVILTSLPSVVNVYNFSSLDWWTLPSSDPAMSKLIPAWWQTFYPITYYFIGCYLGEYGLKINRFFNAVLILVWTVISGSFSYWHSYKTTFIWGDWCGYQSLFNVVLTVLVFSFIMNFDYERFPRWLARFIQKLSGLSLGAYLLSWIFDKALYPLLLERVPEVIYRLEFYVVMVPIIFVLSLSASYLISIIQLVIEKSFSFFCSLRKKRKAVERQA